MSACTHGSGVTELVTVHLGTLWLGIDLQQVLEVSRLPGMAEVPHGPDFVRGVIEVRGEIVTVIDLQRMLGLGSTSISQDSRTVIVRSEGEFIGLLVDCSGEVVSAEDATFESAAGHLEGPIAGYVDHVFRIDGAWLGILDPAAVLSAGVSDTPA